MPGPYAAPIQFEATDTYTEDSDGPEISDNLLQRHPADIDSRLHTGDSLQHLGSLSKSPSAASSSSKSANFRSNRSSSSVSSNSATRPPRAPPSSAPAAPPSPISSSPAPPAPPASAAAVPLRRRAQGIRDSLGTAFSTTRHACALSAVMDNLISSNAPLDKFSSAVDAYIDALPPQKTSKLKKRKDVVVEALYKKPAVSVTGPAYQGKTRHLKLPQCCKCSIAPLGIVTGMGAGACLKLDREDRKEELTKKSDAPESIVITAALTWCAGFCLRRKAGQSRGTCDGELRGQTPLHSAVQSRI